MCRWIVYIGGAGTTPLPLSDVICSPRHSLVRQAFSASYHPGFTARNNAVVNADGFGVSWYSPDGRAALYRSISPAWSDVNLRELSRVVTSHAVFGHVRAASPGSVVSHENTHPFRFGRLTLMHNGHVEGFARLRRSLLRRLSDIAFHAVQGLTDSEHIFGLILSALREPAQAAPFSASELADAVRSALATVLALLAEAGVDGGFTTLNLALTDGETVVATRFCDKWPAIPPPSLYFAYPTHADLRAELDEGIAAVSSTCEPGDGAGGSSRTVVARAAGGDPSTAAADAHGVDSLRWASDCAFLAAAAADGCAESRALLVASEPATEGAHVAWLTLPSNAMLVYERSAGVPPELTTLYGGTPPPTPRM